MPTLASTTAAAQSVASAGLPAGNASWTSVNILNAPDAQAYPIVSFSYIIVYKELNVIPGMTQDEATALVQWLWYMVQTDKTKQQHYPTHHCQQTSSTIDETTIRSITFNGQTLSTT